MDLSDFLAALQVSLDAHPRDDRLRLMEQALIAIIKHLNEIDPYLPKLLIPRP